ncbi:hypothetical protein OS493_012584 [Desmophyllum pertusum]|uniref:Uncharacterized protein n=1 Tax=Desmophyllum pertusum TaxID=174260 RepID=A0A9W9ZEB9_9CNID|nr:hypothetical protein OS493_012584 [Desmophyllum pertusum]
MDFLDMTPTRHTQLAPVKGGNIPPQDSLDQVHKQAELKRALKMYSVISDGEDVRSRTPSPLENNNDLPNALLYENTARLSKLPTKPESPFDSKPRIARTPIHSRRVSAETPLQFQSSTPLPKRFSDMENPGLGVTGHGILATKGSRATENSPLENGVHYDEGTHSKTSGVGSSILGNEDMLGMQRVEVVGQGLLKLDKQHKAESDEETSQLQYETEESDEGVEDDDGEEDEEDEEEDEEDEEEIEGDEEDEEESGTESEQEEYPTQSLTDSQDTDVSAATTTTLTTTSTSSTFKSEESSDSLEDSDDSDSGIRGNSENLRDMTPKNHEEKPVKIHTGEDGTEAAGRRSKASEGTREVWGS